jgi:hypothetical protein
VLSFIKVMIEERPLLKIIIQSLYILCFWNVMNIYTIGWIWKWFC